MRFLPVDPRAPADAEVGSIHRIWDACRRHDQPQSAPRTQAELHVELTAPWPDARSACWLAMDDGTAVGFAWLSLPGGVNDSIVSAQVHVLPGHRHLGAGLGLLREAVRLAFSFGRETFLVQVAEDGLGGDFARRFGGRLVARDVRAVLDLSTVDAKSPDLGDYELTRLAGPAPAELANQIGALHADLAEALMSPVWTYQPHDGARITSTDAILTRRLLTPLRVLAHVRDTGELVGLSLVTLSALAPVRGEQGDIVVSKQHRGRRLGCALTAEMLQWLAADYPAVGELTTWTALENTPIRTLNSRIGYRDVGVWHEWQAPVGDLAARLGML